MKMRSEMDRDQVDRNADTAAERDRTLNTLTQAVRLHQEVAKAWGERLDTLEKRVDANMRRIDNAIGRLVSMESEIRRQAPARRDLIQVDRGTAERWRDLLNRVGGSEDWAPQVKSMFREVDAELTGGGLSECHGDKYRGHPEVVEAEAKLDRLADQFDFIRRACLQAGHDLELALQQAMGEALRDPETAELAAGFPEINPANYNHEDVERLNAWGIAAAQRLRDAGVVATSAPIVKRLAGIIYGLRDLGMDDRLDRRMKEAGKLKLPYIDEARRMVEGQAARVDGDQITSGTWSQAAPVQSFAGEGAVCRGSDRAVLVSEGVLGQILTHVAMGNPDAAVALTTQVKMGEPAPQNDMRAAGGST